MANKNENSSDGSSGGVTQLGANTPMPASPDEAVLEAAANPHPGEDYLCLLYTSPSPRDS